MTINVSKLTRADHQITEVFDDDIETDGAQMSLCTLQKWFPEIKNPYHLKVLNAICPEMTNGPWIGGGAALSWYLNKDLKTDIDVWCRGEIQAETVKHALQKLGLKKHFETDNAITFKGDIHEKEENKLWPPNTVRTTHNGKINKQAITVQIIKRFWPKCAKEIIDDFDITVCKLVTDGVTYIAGRNTYRDIKEKRLHFVKYYPNTFLKRYTKYVSYGFKPEPDTINQAFAEHGHKLNTEYESENEYDF